MQQEGSFTSSVKAELVSQRIRRREDALALLSAFTLAIASLKYVPDKRTWGVHYVLKSKEAVELAAKLIGQYYSLECRLSEVRHQRLKARYYELIAFGAGVDGFLLDTGLMSVDSEGERQYLPVIPEDVLTTDTQKRMFIRGLFLACGMVSVPEKSYHAEFVIQNEALALGAAKLLGECGIEPKLTNRKGSRVVYIKEGEKLEDLLAFMGASSAMMRVSNERIVKQAKNEANRSVNCISANLDRVARSAQRQAEDIRLVLDTVGAENLPDELRIVAEERLNNFELSLSELADELGIGRSAVNYRLKKLHEMAEDIRSGLVP